MIRARGLNKTCIQINHIDFGPTEATYSDCMRDNIQDLIGKLQDFRLQQGQDAENYISAQWAPRIKQRSVVRGDLEDFNGGPKINKGNGLKEGVVNNVSPPGPPSAPDQAALGMIACVHELINGHWCAYSHLEPVCALGLIEVQKAGMNFDTKSAPEKHDKADFEQPAKTDEVGWDSLAIIQEHLLRCRGFSLIVHLEFIKDSSEVQPIILVEKMFSIIGAHFEQWETATFNIESTTLAQSLFNQVSTRLPYLKKLEWTGNLPSTLPNVIVAPRLESLKVGGTSYARRFPRSQLKELILSGYHDATDQTLIDLRMLQTSEKLQRLEFFDWWECPPYHELRFNHLRHLRCYLCALNLFLALPALEILHLEFLLSEGSCTPLPAFIRRSSPPLKFLTLSFIQDWQDSKAVIDALDMLPGLQKLQFNLLNVFIDLEPTMAVLNHLKIKTFDSAPLPNL
ncbi:hypothetical protein C8J56DRAFT_892398 [Mycena floridula]|nr:hypothetical protein C8J56DRAFT_892398 [Mycena floridula]